MRKKCEKGAMNGIFITYGEAPPSLPKGEESRAERELGVAFLRFLPSFLLFQGIPFLPYFPSLPCNPIPLRMAPPLWGGWEGLPLEVVRGLSLDAAAVRGRCFY